MAWKLDDIDFSTYGIHVKSSSGVFDIPRMVDNSTNWLDENGRDYWEESVDVKYEDREIVLACWIIAGDYEDFKTKTQAFYTALTGTGKRTLLTPYGNEIECFLKDQISMVRHSSYVKNIQLGFFSLRLTVAGDSQTKLMYVYHPDWVEGIFVAYGPDAKLNRQFQGISEVTFRAEFNAMNALGRGLYIRLNSDKYISLEYPEIIKESSNKIVYQLKFTHEFFLCRDVPFFVIDNPETFWYANMDEVVDMFVTNMNAAYPGLFEKGDVDITERKNHTFNNESCFDALTRIAGDYEYEWNYTQDPVTGIITVSVKKQIGIASGITFEYGKANNVYKIKRVSTPREKLCTKLFAYGSDKNIPATYGFPRLKLSAPIDRVFFDWNIWRVKTYPDIFPEHTGTVTSYLKKSKAATWVYAPGTEASAHPVKIYTTYPDDNTYELTDSSMFDLKEKDVDGNTVYWLVGTNPKIRFNTGQLAGLEFEVSDFTFDSVAGIGGTFKFLQYKDEAGNIYPSALLYPKPQHGVIGDPDYYPADTYKILDINPPSASIADAESRLYDAAYSDMYDGVVFNPVNADYIVDINPAVNYSHVYPGSTAVVTDADFSITSALRITDVTASLYTNESSITLSPNSVKSSRKNLSSKVTNLEIAIEAANINDVDQTRGNTQTTSELRNNLIDTVDGKLRADDLVRRKSIDPVMLADDAGTPQFSIKDALVEVNVDDDPNVIRINAGSFIHHSYYAVDRKTIKTIKEI